jgi:hypothetical protein
MQRQPTRAVQAQNAARGFGAVRVIAATAAMRLAISATVLIVGETGVSG